LNLVNDAGKYSLMKKRFETAATARQVPAREKSRKVFADEEAIETAQCAPLLAIGAAAGKYSLMKKRLRRSRFSTQRMPCLCRKVFADEEAIETWMDNKHRSSHEGSRKVFADEEAIETATSVALRVDSGRNRPPESIR